MMTLDSFAEPPEPPTTDTTPTEPWPFATTETREQRTTREDAEARLRYSEPVCGPGAFEYEMAVVEHRVAARHRLGHKATIIADVVRPLSERWAQVLAGRSELWTDGFRQWATAQVGTHADSVMFDLTTPKVATVNAMHALAAAVALLRMHDSGEGAHSRWMSVNLFGLPFWERLYPIRRQQPDTLPWCSKVPRPQPSNSAPTYLKLCDDLADWYWDALNTTRQTCAHGQPHNPHSGRWTGERLASADDQQSDLGRWTCWNDTDGECDGCCASNYSTGAELPAPAAMGGAW